MNKFICIIFCLSNSLLAAMQLESLDQSQTDVASQDEKDPEDKLTNEELEKRSYKRCKSYFQNAFESDDLAKIGYIYLWTKAKQQIKTEVAAASGVTAGLGLGLGVVTFGFGAIITAITAPVMVHNIARARAYRKLKGRAKSYLIQSLGKEGARSILKTRGSLRSETFNPPSDKVLDKIKVIINHDVLMSASLYHD